MSACTCCTKKHADPVKVSKSLFHNPDSLHYYALHAYLDTCPENPKALYITGAASFLQSSDPDFPDSCTVVPLDEARIMLLRARDLGSAEAAKLIECLMAEECWE